MKLKNTPKRKAPLKAKSIICGVGVNDADYATQYVVNGKWRMCPFYARWTNMINRCYSANFHIKNPTYSGCSVSREWLLFSVFKAWMEIQDWQGKQLDKDIIVNGNKVYSPELCLFVSAEVNSLLTDSAKIRGAFPVGVSYIKSTGKYLSSVSLKGKKKNIGRFDTAIDAFNAYKTAKYKIIRDIAIEQDEPVKGLLLSHVIK